MAVVERLERAGDAAGSADVSGLVGGVVSVFLNNQLFLLLVGGVLLIFLGAYGFRLWNERNEKRFENVPIEEVVKPGLIRLLERFGGKNGSVLRRDLRTEGVVFRDVLISERADLKDVFKAHNKNSDSKLHVPEKISEEKFNALRELDVFDEEQLELLKQDVVPHRLLQLVPAGLFDKVLWIITDRIAGLRLFTEYYLIPETLLHDNGRDNSISIPRSIQLRKFAGVWIPLYFESFGILHSVVMRHLYEAALEDQANYHKQVNFYNAEFSQKLQEIEKKMEAQNAFYEKKMKDHLS